MKRAMCIWLVILMVVMTGCTPVSEESSEQNSVDDSSTVIPPIEEQLGIELDDLSFKGLNDPELQRYIEDAVYSDLVYRLADDGYYVENVEAIYVSKEYLEELAYNSKENVYFGYTLSELEDAFKGESYVFTLGDNGTTVVEAFQAYDDTFEKALKDIAIGSGIILICVTVSVATGGVAPAVSMVFAASAKTGLTLAVSSGAFSAVASGIVTGIQTKDFDEALKSAVQYGSEGFKWGAISGVLAGGAKELVGLHGATTNGLSIQEAAKIQRESKYPLDVIKEFKNMKQYQICKEAGLKSQRVDGKMALVRKIDWEYTDEIGRTNYQRASQGLAPIEPSSGKAYELHHIGQKEDSTLAILTKKEHMQEGNNLIWHDPSVESTVHNAQNSAKWDAQRMSFWEEFAKSVGGV